MPRRVRSRRRAWPRRAAAGGVADSRRGDCLRLPLIASDCRRRGGLSQRKLAARPSREAADGQGRYASPMPSGSALASSSVIKGHQLSSRVIKGHRGAPRPHRVETALRLDWRPVEAPRGHRQRVEGAGVCRARALSAPPPTQHCAPFRNDGSSCTRRIATERLSLNLTRPW